MAIIGHWRDNVGGQSISAANTFEPFDFAQQIRNDAGGNFSKPNDSTIQLGNAGGIHPTGVGYLGYEFEANIQFETTNNTRTVYQGRIELVSGTGTIFSSYKTGFNRNTQNPTAWVKIWGFVADSSANAQIQIQVRRDTSAGASTSVINASDVQVLAHPYRNIGIYGTTAINAYGGTTPNTVTIDQTVLETDPGEIGRSGNLIQLGGTEAYYKSIWNVSGAFGGQRTQRVGQLEISGTPNLDSRSYCYQRSNTTEYAGLGGKYLHYGSNDDIEIQVWRGDGTGADQGGADSDGSWLSSSTETGICVLQLWADTEAWIGRDDTGLQTLAGVATVDLNVMRDIIREDSTSFVKENDTSIEAQLAMDAEIHSNIWTARQNVASGSRGMFGARVEIEGIDQTLGEDGTYTRGNQGNQDTFAGSMHPGGFFSLVANDSVQIESFDAGDNGGGDRTQPGTAGFYAINLDTIEPPPVTSDISYEYTQATQGATRIAGQSALQYDYTTNAQSASRIAGQVGLNYDYDVAATPNAIVPRSASISYDYSVAIEAGTRVPSSADLSYDYALASDGATRAAGQASLSFDYVLDNQVNLRIDRSAALNYAYSVESSENLIAPSSAGLQYEYETNSQGTIKIPSTGALSYEYDVAASIKDISASTEAELFYFYGGEAVGQVVIKGTVSKVFIIE